MFHCTVNHSNSIWAFLGVLYVSRLFFYVHIRQAGMEAKTRRVLQHFLKAVGVPGDYKH